MMFMSLDLSFFMYAGESADLIVSKLVLEQNFIRDYR